MIADNATGGQANGNLDELLQFVRETVPQPKAMQQLRIKSPPGVISFLWYQREYLVNPSLQVFELKNKEVFVTGASMLMQLALMRRSRGEKIMGASVDMLHQVEEFIKSRDIERGLALLASVKKALGSLAKS